MYTYDPSAISVVVAGIPIKGFAEDTFVTIEHDSESFIDAAGVDGEVTRTKVLDRRARVTIRLMQSSPSNEALSALNNLDMSKKGGAGVGPFMVRDRHGSSIHAGESCWVERPANVEYGRGASAREWMIRVANMTSFQGKSNA